MFRIITVIISYLLGFAYIILSKFIKSDNNKVLFFTFQGKYACNPACICDALLKMKPDVHALWVRTNEQDFFPGCVETVSYGSPSYYNALYTSKVLVENAFNFDKRPYHKKRDQYCIQTMHGSFGLKRIDEGVVTKKRRNRRGYRSAENSNYIISNSTCENSIYRTSFWKHTPILQIGHARNDLLVNTDKHHSTKEMLVKYYGVEKNARFCLYAPTYMRSYSEEYDTLCYDSVKKALQKRFGGIWYIIIRLHPRDIRERTQNEVPEYVLNGNEFDDLHTILPAIEFGITDYSSWICDFSLTRRPGALFVPDLDEYSKDVGFIYPLTDTPYIIAKTNKDLISEILEFRCLDFEKRTEEYLLDKGCIDDGNASMQAARIICDLMEDDESFAQDIAVL